MANNVDDDEAPELVPVDRARVPVTIITGYLGQSILSIFNMMIVSETLELFINDVQ